MRLFNEIVHEFMFRHWNKVNIRYLESKLNNISHLQTVKVYWPNCHSCVSAIKRSLLRHMFGTLNEWFYVISHIHANIINDWKYVAGSCEFSISINYAKIGQVLEHFKTNFDSLLQLDPKSSFMISKCHLTCLVRMSYDIPRSPLVEIFKNNKLRYRLCWFIIYENWFKGGYRI